MVKLSIRVDEATKKRIAEAAVGPQAKVLAIASGPLEAVSELDAVKALAIALAERLDALLMVMEKREEVNLPQGR